MCSPAWSHEPAGLVTCRGVLGDRCHLWLAGRIDLKYKWAFQISAAAAVQDVDVGLLRVQVFSRASVV